MARLDEYRTYIQDILKKHGSVQLRISSDEDEIDREVICDTVNDHYLLVEIGWQGLKPVDNHIIHVDLKEGKIWIRRDFTEYGVANELVDLGVPKADIVLAFHAPYKRPYTGFAA